MMKLPIQVAPVQRGGSAARYATSSGIKPSENLCSCYWPGGWTPCVVKWDHCPEGYHASCNWKAVTCHCDCCNDAGHCFGDFP
jgi:hypothetical protein